MNTDHLKYLIEISKSSSLQQASEKLFVSPQALSKAMANLESELGMPLLVRSYNGVRLTVNGWWLVELSSKYLDAIEERQENYLKNLHKLDQTPEGKLNIAVNHCGMDTNPIYSFISQLASTTPSLTINIHDASYTAFMEQLKNKESNIGLSYRIKYHQSYVNDFDPTLLWIPLQTTPLYLMASKKLIPNPPKSISLKKALQYPLCCFELETAIWQNTIDKLFHSEAECPVINHWGIFQSHIENGYYTTLTTIPKNTTQPVNAAPNTSLIEIRDDIQVVFGYFRPTNDLDLTANATFFIRQLEEYLREQNAEKTKHTK